MICECQFEDYSEESAHEAGCCQNEAVGLYLRSNQKLWLCGYCVISSDTELEVDKDK